MSSPACSTGEFAKANVQTACHIERKASLTEGSKRKVLKGAGSVMFAALSVFGSVAALVLMYHWKYLITLGLRDIHGAMVVIAQL
jgi:hypothetical protein